MIHVILSVSISVSLCLSLSLSLSLLSGQVSITLRHRLVCEIRSQQTISLPPSILNSEEVCPVEPEKDFPVAPTKPRMPTKFETKIIISQEDLKTKMLVRLSLKL